MVFVAYGSVRVDPAQGPCSREEIKHEEARAIACIAMPDIFRLFANAKEYQHGKAQSPYFGPEAVELPYHLNLRLDNGVKSAEISEIITHLAFYSGWANATSAVGITKAVFDKRGVASAQLPPATGDLLPLDEAAEAKRANGVQQNFGSGMYYLT
jgi:hypothetical protein